MEKIREVFDLDINPVVLLKRYASRNPFPAIVHHIMEQYKNEEGFANYQPRGRCCEPQPVNFYWDMYSAGKPYYVRTKYPSLKSTMQCIHGAGEITVLAHLQLNFCQKEERLQRAPDEGIDGIEAYSNYHEVKHNCYYDACCRRCGALVSCGGDFRGKVKPKIRVGKYGYRKDDGEETLQAFLGRLAK